MKVLCLFRYVGRDDVRLRELDDAVMIDVDRLDQVHVAFERKIAMNRKHGTWIGPRPLRWMLTGYLPASGAKYFKPEFFDLSNAQGEDLPTDWIN